KDQPGGSGNTPVPDQALNYDRNLASQQDARTAGYFFSDWGEQLGARLGDIATNNQNFRIKDVQNADYGGSQVIESTLEYAICALISLRSCAKNCLRVGRLSSLLKRQLRGRGAVKMSQVIGLDGPRGKASFHATPIS